MKTTALLYLSMIGIALSPNTVRADTAFSPGERVVIAARAFLRELEDLRDYRNDVNETIVRDLINKLIAREFPKIRERTARATEMTKVSAPSPTLEEMQVEGPEFERNTDLVKSIHRVAEDFQKAIVAPGGLYPSMEEFAICTRALIRDERTLDSLDQAVQLLDSFYELHDSNQADVLVESPLANPYEFFRSTLSERTAPWIAGLRDLNRQCAGMLGNSAGGKIEYTEEDIRVAAGHSSRHQNLVKAALTRIAFPSVERIDIPASVRAGFVVLGIELMVGKIYRLTDGTAYLAPLGLRLDVGVGGISATVSSYALDGSGSSRWLNGNSASSPWLNGSGLDDKQEPLQFPETAVFPGVRARNGRFPNDPKSLIPKADSLVGVGVGFSGVTQTVLEGGLDLTIPAAGLCTTKGDYLLCVPRPDGTPWRKPRKMSIASDVWENGRYDAKAPLNNW